MSPEELLGFVNNFVEHDTKHVVIIANEIELYKKPTYKDIREKVIGFSLDVRPDFESALGRFNSDFPESYQKFLKNSQEDLISVLSQTGSKNVRVTKYVLSEFHEVFEQTVTAGIRPDDIRAMFLAFFILDYAYKTGTLTREDIKNRNTDGFMRAVLSTREDHEPSEMERLSQAHANVDVYTSSFDNEYLEAKICDGFHDSEKLARTLGDLTGKTDSKQNSEWRNLWHLIDQDDEVVEESFVRMMGNFETRSYQDAGVILHVFGLLHRLREAGLLKWTAKRITRECKRYISDMFESHSLPLLGSDLISSYRHGSAHGLGFTSIGDPGFQEAQNFYREKSQELKNYLILGELNAIIENEKFDLSAFRAIILQGAREDNVFGKPFLHLTDAAKFAASVMKEPAELQFAILTAVGSRYSQSPYREVRITEAPWLRKLIRALRSIVKQRSVVAKFRIEETIQWNLAVPAAPDAIENSDALELR